MAQRPIENGVALTVFVKRGEYAPEIVDKKLSRLQYALSHNPIGIKLVKQTESESSSLRAITFTLNTLDLQTALWDIARQIDENAEGLSYRLDVTVAPVKYG